jgi:hypothetical protein
MPRNKNENGYGKDEWAAQKFTHRDWNVSVVFAHKRRKHGDRPGNGGSRTILLMRLIIKK